MRFSSLRSQIELYYSVKMATVYGPTVYVRYNSIMDSVELWKRKSVLPNFSVIFPTLEYLYYP